MIKQLIRKQRYEEREWPLIRTMLFEKEYKAFLESQQKSKKLNKKQ